MIRMPLRVRLAYALHRNVANPLAWRFACPPGPVWGRAYRINRRHPLWRFNDWLAGFWTDWWRTNL